MDHQTVASISSAPVELLIEGIFDRHLPWKSRQSFARGRLTGTDIQHYAPPCLMWQQSCVSSFFLFNPCRTSAAVASRQVVQAQVSVLKLRLTQVDLILFKVAIVCLFFCTQQQREAADRCLEMSPRKGKKMILRAVTRAAILPAGPDSSVNRYAGQINSVSKLFMATGVAGENTLPPPPPTPKLSSNCASHYCPPPSNCLKAIIHLCLPHLHLLLIRSCVAERARHEHMPTNSLSLCEDVCTHF